jgi:hypothetical protein
MARLVIDSNFLQSDGLRAYLAKSPANYAVMTDYAAMEAYKADTLDMLYRSMAVLGEFPRQVIILKGTQAVCGLSGRAAGLQRRMIDQQQTRGFAEYCRHLAAARAGNLSIQAQLLEYARTARLQMERILLDVQDFAGALEGIADMFDSNELQILRKCEAFTPDMARTIMHQILGSASALFARHPRAPRLRPTRELPNMFLFRTALCMYILGKRWLSVGGAHQARPERLRNDLIDVNFATFATYFDGLLTADRKSMATYEETRWVLNHVFPSPPAPDGLRLQ